MQQIDINDNATNRKVYTLKYKQRGTFGDWLLIKDYKKQHKRPVLQSWVNHIVNGLIPEVNIPILRIQIIPYLTNKEFNSLSYLLNQQLPNEVEKIIFIKRTK